MQGTVTRLRRYTMKANKPGPADEGGQDYCPDLSSLENMHEAGILHCMRMRFTAGNLDVDAQKVEISTFCRSALCSPATSSSLLDWLSAHTTCSSLC